MPALKQFTDHATNGCIDPGSLFKQLFPVRGKGPDVPGGPCTRPDSTPEELSAWDGRQLAAVVNRRSGFCVYDADGRGWMPPGAVRQDHHDDLKTLNGRRVIYRRPLKDETEWTRDEQLWRGDREHEELKFVADHYFLLPHPDDLGRMWEVAVEPEDRRNRCTGTCTPSTRSGSYSSWNVRRVSRSGPSNRAK